MSRQNSGCGMLVIGVLLIGALLWAVSAAVARRPCRSRTLGAGYFLLLAKQAREEVAARAAADAELEALAQDAAFDLADTINRWDTLVVTKGIGTELRGREEEAAAIQQQLFAAHEALLSAPSVSHRIRAAVHADSVRQSRRAAPLGVPCRSSSSAPARSTATPAVSSWTACAAHFRSSTTPPSSSPATVRPPPWSTG